MVRMGLFLNGTALVSSMTRVVDRVLIGLTPDAAAGFRQRSPVDVATIHASEQAAHDRCGSVLSRLQHDERLSEVLPPWGGGHRVALFPCFIVAFFGRSTSCPRPGVPVG